MLPALALAGGGTLASMFLGSAAQDKVDEARGRVLAAERARQAAFDAEAEKINTGAQDRYQGFGAQQDARATQLADMFKQPVVTPTTPNTIAALPPTTSDLVSREIANKSGIAKDYVEHQGDTLGKLRSFGDLFGDISREQAHDAQLVGQVGGFKRGSAGVQALELDSANNAGNDLKFWADLSNGVAKTALTAGLSGAFAPASAAATAAPGAPMNILPPAARLDASVFARGATPFLTYGRG